MPERAPVLSTSFAQSAKGRCTWLSSLVSLILFERCWSYPRQSARSTINTVIVSLIVPG